MARLLIADDERDVRELIIFALRFAGHEVQGVSNGEELLNLVKENMPDLIIMDVRMPKMNGYEACKILKADNSTSSIPVIFLSARGNDEDVKAGLDAGGIEYVLKPISPDKLTEKVDQHLKKVTKRV
jgi:DNA-binding response OmpR family regulator